jgi:hypothetical protein
MEVTEFDVDDDVDDGDAIDELVRYRGVDGTEEIVALESDMIQSTGLEIELSHTHIIWINDA